MRADIYTDRDISTHHTEMYTVETVSILSAVSILLNV